MLPFGNWKKGNSGVYMSVVALWPCKSRLRGCMIDRDKGHVEGVGGILSTL